MTVIGICILIILVGISSIRNRLKRYAIQRAYIESKEKNKEAINESLKIAHAVKV